MLSHSTELLINAWDGWRYSHISLSNTIIALLAPGGWYLSCPVCLVIESRRTARRKFSLKMQSPIDVRRALLWGVESRGKCLYLPGPLFKFTHRSSLFFRFSSGTLGPMVSDWDYATHAFLFFSPTCFFARPHHICKFLNFVKCVPFIS